jgi:Domain of unknown function (DUF6456)
MTNKPRRVFRPGPLRPEIDRFRAQHLALSEGEIETEIGRAAAVFNEAESPLIWLARRKGRDGRALIEPHQFLAGERLRAEFTRANMMPRTTSSWSSPIASGHRGGRTADTATDTMIAARQRVQRALDAVDPEFAGLLMDVCCFLKGLADVERERSWPPRTAKIVLQLGLDRLARHYGLEGAVRGPSHAPMRAWSIDEEPSGGG